jgi:hypothetical protein
VIGIFPDEEVSKKALIGSAAGDDAIGHVRCEDAFVWHSVLGADKLLEEVRAGTKREFVRPLLAHLDEGLACLFADLLLFRDVENDLLHRQVRGEGDLIFTLALRFLSFVGCDGFLFSRRGAGLEAIEIELLLIIERINDTLGALSKDLFPKPLNLLFEMGDLSFLGIYLHKKLEILLFKLFYGSDLHENMLPYFHAFSKGFG